MNEKTTLRTTYKKIFSNLGKQAQVIAVLRRIIAQQHNIWKQYLMEMFKSIGKPIEYSTADKLEQTMFYKVKGFFPNPADANDAMEDLIEFLIRTQWFEKLKPELDTKNIGKLLLYKTKLRLISLKNEKRQRKKEQESFEPDNYDYESEMKDTLETHLRTPQDAIQMFEKEKDDAEWSLIFKDFLAHLITKTHSRIPLDNIFEDYFLEGFTLNEIAEDFDVTPTLIKNKTVEIGKEFLNFLGEGVYKVDPDFIKQELGAY